MVAKSEHLRPASIVAQACVPAATRESIAAVEIELGGAIVRVRDGTAAATLRMVLACVRETAP